MATAKPKMSETAVKKSLTVWEGRLDKARHQQSYRYDKWHFYRYDSKRPAAERKELRSKWWKSYQDAHSDVVNASNQVSQRRAECKWYADRKPKGSSREACVKHAKSFVGVKEQPSGSNGGGIIATWERRLGFGRVAWCGIFAGNMLLDAGVTGVSSTIASVSAIYYGSASGQACFSGRSRDIRRVLPGDLVVLFGIGTHVEMVASVDVARGIVYTVGGNTSSSTAGSQSNGGCVATHARPMSAVIAFAHVDFPG